LGWGPGPDEVGQKCLNDLFMTSPTKKKQIQNFPVFQIITSFFCISWVFEQLSSSVAWWVMVVQNDTRKVAQVGFESMSILYTSSQHVGICTKILSSQLFLPHDEKW